MAGITQGIPGMVEHILGPGIDIVAARALPWPVTTGGRVAGDAVHRSGMVVGDRLPVGRIMAIGAGIQVVRNGRFMAAGAVR